MSLKWLSFKTLDIKVKEKMLENKLFLYLEESFFFQKFRKPLELIHVLETYIRLK